MVIYIFLQHPPPPVKQINVNQVLSSFICGDIIFVFRDLLQINWFTTTTFCKKIVFYRPLLSQPFDKDWFEATRIRDHKALANIVKFSLLRIKVKNWFTNTQTWQFISYLIIPPKHLNTLKKLTVKQIFVHKYKKKRF